MKTPFKQTIFVRIMVAMLCLLAIMPVSAQQGNSPLTHRAGIFGALPFSEFSRSHVWGLGLQYQAAYRLASSNSLIQQMDLLGDISLSYFSGKSAPADGYPFGYFDYWSADLGLGLQHRVASSFRYGLVAGPLLRRYGGNFRAGWNAQLQTQWNLNEHFSLGPSLQVAKASQTNALWSARFGVWYQWP